MRQLRDSRPRRIASWAERSLWALGLSLLAFWGYHQAALRFEQARLEESFFARAASSFRDGTHPDDSAHAALAAAAPDVHPPLEPGAPLGLIEIARIGVRAMVVEGVDHRALRRAVGHVPGTSLPGWSGNAVLAAHRDTLFAGLRDVELGDAVTMQTDHGEFAYRVSSIEVVSPTTVEVMDPTSDTLLTLITCFPFDFVGPAPMRFVVRASLDGAGEETPAQEPPAAGRPAAPSRLVRAGSAPPRRPLDPDVMSFLSGSLVKPGAN